MWLQKTNSLSVLRITSVKIGSVHSTLVYCPVVWFCSKIKMLHLYRTSITCVCSSLGSLQPSAALSKQWVSSTCQVSLIFYYLQLVPCCKMGHISSAALLCFLLYMYCVRVLLVYTFESFIVKNAACVQQFRENSR